MARLVAAINVRRSKVRACRKGRKGEKEKDGGEDEKKRNKVGAREDARYFYVFYTQRVWFHRSVAATTRECPGEGGGEVGGQDGWKGAVKSTRSWRG